MRPTVVYAGAVVVSILSTEGAGLLAHGGHWLIAGPLWLVAVGALYVGFMVLPYAVRASTKGAKPKRCVGCAVQSKDQADHLSQCSWLETSRYEAERGP